MRPIASQLYNAIQLIKGSSERSHNERFRTVACGAKRSFRNAPLWNSALNGWQRRGAGRNSLLNVLAYHSISQVGGVQPERLKPNGKTAGLPAGILAQQ